ncbi:AAA-like domain-containing protein [Trichocoleus sp. ST-U3]
MATVTSNINQARAMRVAVNRIEGFAKQFGETHRNLARHAAFPLVLTPDLLYQIWANFVLEAPWTAVAHLLLSRLCRQVGYEMYEMDITDRNLLLRELKEQFGQKRLDELGEFLLDYVAQRLTEDDPDTQDLAEAQEWTALAYTQPNKAARNLAEALSLKVKQQDITEIFRLTSLVKTFAEPLAQSGFEPLLIYADGITTFVRGNQEGAATQFAKLPIHRDQVEIVGVTLDIPLSEAPNPAYKYQIGGSLARDTPTYVVRQADEEFYQALKAGEFCYVLNSRQTGKSSLRVQTMRRLQADGIACGVIDVTSIGSHDITPSEWYLGVVRRLMRSFGLKIKIIQWWNEREGLLPTQRLVEFLETVLLEEIPHKIVIFIDEIDSISQLSFKDDFFTLIRFCYNKRADNPQYQRLTFALLGVATPSDLIQDKSRTPFNIGSAIELRGFQLQEVQPLEGGLQGKVDNPQKVLKEILAWTGGQPFLTQKLCKLVLSSPFTIASGSEAELIEQLVRSGIIDNWESTDEPEHLRRIRDHLLGGGQRSSQMLLLYRQILEQGEVVADESPEQTELCLSGLVVRQDGKLRVFNRIYEAVFNLTWVEQALKRTGIS